MPAIQTGRLLKFVGAHTYSENLDSIGICLSGKNNFTLRQFEEAGKLVSNLMYAFNIDAKNVYGHNHFTSLKSCPNFDVKNFKNMFLI